MAVKILSKKTIDSEKYIELECTLFCSGYIETNGLLHSEHYECGKDKDDKSGHHYYKEISLAREKQYFAVGKHPDGSPKFTKKTIKTNKGPIDCSVGGFSDVAKKFKWQKGY